MNIGIDVDGVLTNIQKFKMEQGLQYCQQYEKGKLVNPNAYSSRDIFHWDDIWEKIQMELEIRKQLGGKMC